jgi:Family of unknown function (DUF6807)
MQIINKNKKNSTNMKQLLLKIFLSVLLISLGMTQSCKEESVELINDEANNKVDVIINGALFTSYQYPENVEKPFLYPVISPNGSIITRGFPIEPREGERVDHPHHVGIWFNHGDVNGLDFWNNSSAIAAEKKDSYGHIVHQKIIKAEGGETGVLEVIMNWDDSKGNTLLIENTRYVFSGDLNSRTIDHITTLTAVADTVTFYDSKEGSFAIRVDRAFEMPAEGPSVFTDDKGNPTKVEATDNTGVTGMYFSNQGLTGGDVWGTRNDWVVLSGVKDDTEIAFGIFDNPKNTGYPAYAHARGYGLFSVNNFGQNSYDPSKEKMTYTLEKGESVKLYHRFYLQSGNKLTSEKANMIFSEFTKAY